MNVITAFRLNKNILPLTHSFEKGSKLLFKPKITIYNVRFCPSQKGFHKPSTFDKYMLVWMKKFPSVAEVPQTVSHEMLKKCRDWARIKINIIFCIITGVVCVFMVYSGKSAAKRGENLHKKNIDWHAELNAKKE